MATKRPRRTRDTVTAKPVLETEIAHRLIDPFETSFMGVIRPNDPLLGEHGNNWTIYRDLLRDGKVFSTLQRRVLALVGRPWTVQPVDGTSTEDAETVQRILTRFNFDRLCADLMDALLAGFSPVEIIWTVRDGLVEPRRTAKRAQRRFVYVQDDVTLPPQLRMLVAEDMTRGVELPERKFIVHRVNPEDDNPYGTGLGLQLYWAVFFKRKGIAAWSKLNDRYGTPVPWGRHPRDAKQPEKNTLFQALKAFTSDGVIMTPEGTLIELLESKLTGSVSTQESMCGYMDDWIAEVVLGQEPRAKSGGALAAASKEREGVRLEIVQADSDLLSETLNNTLIRWICEYNGLAPCLIYRQIKADEDKLAQSQTDNNVAALGFELSEDAVRERYGDGWSRAKASAPATPPSPPTPAKKDTRANFAEPESGGGGQAAIDAAIAGVKDADLLAALQAMVEPLLAAIESTDNFEDALFAAETAYPDMDTARLQEILARAIFGAEVYGRQVES